MNMKTISLKVIIIGLIFFLTGVGTLYLIYETWVIFGFWRLIITGIINLLASLILIQLIGSRKSVNEGVIIYNPKE